MAYQKIEGSLSPITVDAKEQSKDLDFYLGFEKQDDEHSFDEMLNECTDITWDTASWCKVKLKIQDNTAYKITLNIEKNVVEEPRNCTVTFYNQSFDKNESDTKIVVQQQAAYYPFMFFNINNVNTLVAFPFQDNDETSRIQINNTIYNFDNNTLFNFKFGKQNLTNFISNNNFSLSGTMLKSGSTTETVNISDVLEIVNIGDKFTLQIKNDRPSVKKGEQSSNTKILLNLNSNQYTLNFKIKLPTPQDTVLWIFKPTPDDYTDNLHWPNKGVGVVNNYILELTYTEGNQEYILSTATYVQQNNEWNIIYNQLQSNTLNNTTSFFYFNNGNKQQGYYAKVLYLYKYLKSAYKRSTPSETYTKLPKSIFDKITEIKLVYKPNNIHVHTKKFNAGEMYNYVIATKDEPFMPNEFASNFLLYYPYYQNDIYIDNAIIISWLPKYWQ